MSHNLSDDDEIIEEIPIYISKTLSDQLYIFQYPNKKTDFNMDSSEVVKSCIKPLNQDVKIDFGLNTASVHYDAFKGERFAIEADGQRHNRNERPSYRNGTMDRQTYISTRPMDNVNKYVLGVLHKENNRNEIHAVPLTGIVQLRPSFSYFDKSDKRLKAEQKAENEADMDEEEATTVSVKFARQENDKFRKAREKSFNFLSQKFADEAWCETMWYPKDSHQAELERQKLFTAINQPSDHSLSLKNDEYLKSLIPPERSTVDIDSLVASPVISMAKLKQLPLMDQIRIILTDAKVVKFDHLVEILMEKSIDKTLTADKVLRTLRSIGLLVKGNWTVLSETLYPDGSVSAIHGVPAEFMRRGRDYVLYQFSKMDYVSRQKVILNTQLPPDEVHEILQTVAQLDRLKNKWHLLLPPDLQFEKNNQEIKQRQDNIWRAMEVKFQEMELDQKSQSKRSRRRSIREVKSDSVK
ncbi:DNA-directed RNA polymerase III subunit RPC5 [Pseudolycoriella hygida]|uniref:DNA-directed RNA polymerase III subunit RPC5 n=1 Tax=Pseudolycoriella hygida TaxID=35572 RepID=A0A9Q0S1E3_9DIPT|nr:DNA-directed RNA polymerase III subunit RPC5 [Pseudolycoriella hygida]